MRAMEKWCASQGKVMVQKKVKKAVRRRKRAAVDAAAEAEAESRQVSARSSATAALWFSSADVNHLLCCLWCQPPISDCGFFSQAELEEKWDDVAGSLSEILQDLEEIDEDVSPFDAAADLSEEEQRYRTLFDLL